MIISNKFELIFVKTRKTAGSAIEIALSQFLGEKDVITPCMPVEEEAIRRTLGFRGPQNYEKSVKAWKARDFVDFARGHRPKLFSAHTSAKLIQRELPPEAWEGYHKVLTVRNPFTYVVSLYNWAHRREEKTAQGFREWLNQGRGDLRFSNYGMGKVRGDFSMDQVLRFETLNADLIDLAERCNIPPQFIDTFKGIRVKDLDDAGKLSVAHAYTSFPGTARRVRQLFAEELELFGYELPPDAQ